MAGTRKLLGEIDRTLKKVHEGVEFFDSIWEKVYSAIQQNQKEKYEQDLKKEIKKLQRFRDQIKAWISSSDVKDKKPLMETRKLIESKMEQFKIYEKETKTKAYSKEGLAQQEKLDPHEQAKLDTRNWIQDHLCQLSEQIEGFEADLELMYNQKSKKNNKEDVERLESLNLRHKWHIQKLEQVTRLLDNDVLNYEDVDAIKEDLDYYLEANQEPDFMETYGEEDVYEALDLDAAARSIGALGTDKDGLLDEGEENELKTAETEERDQTIRTSPTVSPEPQSLGLVSSNLSISPTSSRLSTVPVRSPVNESKTAGKQMFNDGRASLPNSFESQRKLESNQMTPTRTAQQTLPSRSQTLQQQHQQHSFSPSSQHHPPSKPPPQSPHQSRSQQQESTKRVPEGESTKPASSNDGTTSYYPSPRSIKNEPRSPFVLSRSPSPNASPSLSPTSGPPVISEDQRQVLQMLDASLTYIPDSRDSERPKHYLPRNPYPTPSSFPTLPATLFENPAVFEKFDTDTLFFIFYYQQGTYQQYLAARELKKHNWAYHKKYMTWFKRHEEPKKVSDDFEQGTYVYFDHETGWCQRIKSEFTFEYSYLEDELAV